MTDFETRVQEILNADTPNHVKLSEIRKLYTPKIDPTTCKNDRLYRVVVSDYETIGWRGSKWEFRWSVRWRDGSVRWEEDHNITVLGEYHPVNLTTHPAYLETLEDYQNAPENTVIGSRWAETCPTYVRDVCREWVAVGGANSVKTANLAGTRRRVLYWPEEEE